MLPHASFRLHGVPLPASRGWAAARSPGETDTGARGARVCIVPLQGSRCYSPHSGQDPGVRSQGGQEGPCKRRRPHSSTDLHWLLQKHACRRSSPSATPPQGVDTINCRHRTHQGARLSLSKLLYMFPRGERGPGRCWDRFVGKCLVMLGAGYTVFPKRGSYGHLSQGPPVQPLERRPWGCPRVSTSPP